MQVLSLIGAVLVLIGYYMLMTGRWASDGFNYAGINVLGGWLLLFVAVHDNRWGFILLNGVFTAISVWYLFNQPKRKPKDGWKS